MYALIMLMASSVLLASARKDQAENVFPCLLLSVIMILYPFYCFDRLQLGKALVYGMITLTWILSAAVILRQKRPLIRSVMQTLSPGVFLFAAYCGFVFCYTQGNLVGLWDELRLWGAVPKALYATDALQLGADALIFGAMQAYPPGMPLLVYFMESLSPSFSESYVFLVYGIFFGAMLLPALKNLKWRNWPVFLPLLLLLAYAPCLFTSHGGDDGWFYESLFIDPILGVLAGYTFYLSSGRPFADGFSRYRFAAALLSLTVIKDSGALFAVFAAVHALALSFLFEKEKRIGKGMAINTAGVALPILLGYGLWRYVLSGFGIGSNASGFVKLELTRDSLLVLWEKLRDMPMLNLMEPILKTQLSLSFFPSLMVLLILFWICTRETTRSKKREHVLSWAMILASFLVFLIGYRLSFRGSLPSFQRYVSATLICAMAYCLLHGIPALLERSEPSEGRKYALKRVFRGIICVFLCFSVGLSLKEWKTRKYDMEYAKAPARTAVSKIRNSLEETDGTPANLYVMISEKPRQKSLIHHRIYYELLGTQACVRNFWNDVNIVGGEETPETWTQEEITRAADQWVQKLRSGDYQYVYVVTVNDFTAAVLAQYGVFEVKSGDLYRIEFSGEGCRFVAV